MVGRWLADGWPTIGRRLADGWLTVGRRLADGWPMVSSRLADGWPTDSRLLADGLLPIFGRASLHGSRMLRGSASYSIIPYEPINYLLHILPTLVRIALYQR